MYELLEILTQKAGLVNENEINDMIERINDGKSKIFICSKNKNGTCCIEINKIELIVVMEYLKEHFPDNNQVSSKLLEILPDAWIIVCDDKKNKTQDIPGIEVWTLTKKQLVKIRRNDFICWEIINKARGAI